MAKARRTSLELDGSNQRTWERIHGVDVDSNYEACTYCWVETRFKSTWKTGFRFPQREARDICGWLFLAWLCPLQEGSEEQR